MIFKNDLKSELSNSREWALWTLKAENQLTRIKKTSFDKKLIGWNHFTYSPANSNPLTRQDFCFHCDVELAGKDCIKQARVVFLSQWLTLLEQNFVLKTFKFREFTIFEKFRGINFHEFEAEKLAKYSANI